MPHVFCRPGRGLHPRADMAASRKGLPEWQAAKPEIARSVATSRSQPVRSLTELRARDSLEHVARGYVRQTRRTWFPRASPTTTMELRRIRRGSSAPNTVEPARPRTIVVRVEPRNSCVHVSRLRLVVRYFCGLPSGGTVRSSRRGRHVESVVGPVLPATIRRPLRSNQYPWGNPVRLLRPPGAFHSMRDRRSGDTLSTFCGTQSTLQGGDAFHASFRRNDAVP